MAHTAPPPDKAALRRTLAAARGLRTDDQIERARTRIRAAVLARAATERWRRVAGYVPLRTEPGSISLLDGLCSAGAEVIVPVLLPDRDLDWVRWQAGAGAGESATPLGVEAISTVDAVLVPASAVSRDGTRLGRGGGSYDRALRRVGPGVARIALIYDDELVDRLPCEAWDEPVTVALTASGWHRLAGAARDPGPGPRADSWTGNNSTRDYH